MTVVEFVGKGANIMGVFPISRDCRKSVNWKKVVLMKLEKVLNQMSNWWYLRIKVPIQCVYRPFQAIVEKCNSEKELFYFRFQKLEFENVISDDKLVSIQWQ